ncbi:Uncharacterised protein [Vibrio anguillarum]|nr:hypothetical protein N175_11115 [Vibrio anguillarum M3]STY55193.1 Uncharacterised protein [Vibrio anguillarum]
MQAECDVQHALVWFCSNSDQLRPLFEWISFVYIIRSGLVFISKPLG